jgi:hypothetical protein
LIRSFWIIREHGRFREFIGRKRFREFYLIRNKGGIGKVGGGGVHGMMYILLFVFDLMEFFCDVKWECVL